MKSTCNIEHSENDKKKLLSNLKHLEYYHS